MSEDNEIYLLIVVNDNKDDHDIDGSWKIKLCRRNMIMRLLLKAETRYR